MDKSIQVRKFEDGAYIAIRLEDTIMTGWGMAVTSPMREYPGPDPVLLDELTPYTPYSSRFLLPEKLYAGAPVHAERGELIAVYALDESTLPAACNGQQEITFRRVS